MKYLVSVLALFLFVLKFYPVDPVKSNFTYTEIQKINPVFVIDTYTLTSPELTSEVGNNFLKTLQEREIVLSHPLFGNVYNPTMYGTRLNVIIQSGGGLVSQGKLVSEMLIAVRNAGFPIDCYVSEAQSMAFFIMLTSCSKIIAKPNVKLMQHRSAYGGVNTTPDTYITDIYMAKKEAERIGMDHNKWLEITRTGTDKVFTLPEMLKYKLVDEFLKE